MRDFIQWFIKGAAMGMADIVPGISGGTIAFILGIYERFLQALTNFNVHAVKLLFAARLKSFWQHIDGSFLLCLFSGILSAIFSLANLITYMLEYQPVLLWSFFNGLILASLPLLIRKFSWTPYRAFIFLVGAVFAAAITTLTPVHTDPTYWMFLGAGFISICAMMLPGISGSFLLLIMGMYTPITSAVSNLNLAPLGFFAIGAVAGLLIFSRLLKWALDRAHDAMLALLSGVVVGALLRIWPWQIEGELVSPNSYAAVNTNSELGWAVLAFVLGAALIQVLLHLENLFSNASEPTA